MRHLDFTYAYGFAARAVSAVMPVGDQEDFLTDFLADNDDDFVRLVCKPQQVTLLHNFIHALNVSDLEWATKKFGPESGDMFADLIASSGLDVPDWVLEDRWPDEGEQVLDQLLARAARIVTDAAFQMLFADRPFLYAFQELVSERVREIDASRFPGSFKSQGVVRRPAHLPQWLRRAVFHRDRGRCQRCLTDLTGLSILNENLRIDHMFPLAESGSNDPTNFQLLCEGCNLQKSASKVFDRQRVHTYW